MHIHLVKFDVTSSDGSANGWNYEDGTFSPDEVRERITASKHQGGNVKDWNGNHTTLSAKSYALPNASSKDARGQCSSNSEDNSKNHPWCGAQATVQRWWADPILNDKSQDRTMRAVFTHDHYGPSSHQQHGFYAALIVEPKETVWTKLVASPADVTSAKPCEHKTTLGGAFNQPCRNDGGPTSYAANIGLSPDHHHKNKAEHQHEIRREYNLAFADFAILYNADLRPVNPPSRQDELLLPHNIRDGLKPKPEGISTEDPGTRLLNYRNEPIPLRIGEEDSNSLEYKQKAIASGGKSEGDMANVFSSLVHSYVKPLESANVRLAKLQRNVPNEIINPVELKNLLDQQIAKTTKFIDKLNAAEPWRLKGDPSTPVLPAYACDPFSIHLIQGAQEEQHVFSMNGLKWLAEPKALNSGYMNGQQIGISEHFEMDVKLPNDPGVTDYWYGSPSVENFWDGMWGLVRAYGGRKCTPENNESFADLTINKYKYSQSEKHNENKLAVMAEADRINEILAVLPTKKNIETENDPDLWEVDEQDPGDQLDVVYKSGAFINDLLEKSVKDASKIPHLLSYLNEELMPDVPVLNGKSIKNKTKTIKDLFKEYFNKNIWQKNVCPFQEYVKSSNHKKHVVAILAKDILPNHNSLVYNKRFNMADPNGIVFVELDEEWIAEHQEQHIKTIIDKLNKKQVGLHNNFHLSASEIVNMLRTAYEDGKAVEPLVLRASAGDCLQVTLHNLLPESFLERVSPANSANSSSYNLMPPIVSGFNFNQIQMSSTINLIPQLVAYDVKSMGGGKIGLNSRDEEFNKEDNRATSGLPGCRKLSSDGKPDFSLCDKNVAEYIWYAGNRQEFDKNTFDSFTDEQQKAECPIKTKFRYDKGYLCHKPIEYGVASLRSFGDVIKQSSHGAVGALVIEPKNAEISFPDKSSKITADVKAVDEHGKHSNFREFVVVFQDDLSLQQNKQPMPNHRMADDAEDTGQKGFNYRSEPLWARNGVGTSGADFNTLNEMDYRNTLSSIAPNPGCGSQACGDPETPVFKASAGSDIRFRLVHPNGHSRQHAFVLHGHNWDYQPWKNDSTSIATREEKAIRTANLGAIGGIGPGRHFNVVTKAGGKNEVPGDYLFRVQENFQFHGGMWGILRVE